MKPLFSLLTLVCLFFILPVQAQVEKDYVYTIHVGAYVNPRLADFDPIRPLGFLYGKSFDNNLLRIYLGDFRLEDDARKVLASVKNNGFSDAYLTKIPANRGEKVAVIQVATKLASEKIDWENYATGTAVQVLSLDGALKIAFGPYASADAASQQLSTVRSSGFSDAFVKIVDEQLLHPITLQQTKESMVKSQATTRDVIPSSYDASVALTPSNDVLTSKAPVTTTPPPAEPIPASYDDVMTLKSPAKTIALPTIRTQVKRNSAYELQKVLKTEGTYTSSLDGYYGKGTAAAYEKIKTTNAQLVKYKILAQQTARPTIAPQKGSIQYAINNLLDNTPSSILILEQSNSPITKAYRAYVYFESQGPSARADQLMNDAIQQAFNRQGVQNKPPFDFTSTYSYKDINQLILHLRYIQTADPNKTAAPCWLFSKHPEAAATAFESGPYFSDDNYAIEACNQMVDWEELKLLETIAEDLNPTGKIDITAMRENAYKRSRLLLLNRSLSPEAATAAENWHINLWKGLDAWAQEDLLHQKLVLPLRITYFQSMVRLEDFYMDKGQQPKAARQLAAQTLRTIIGLHLDGYAAQS